MRRPGLPRRQRLVEGVIALAAICGLRRDQAGASAALFERIKSRRDPDSHSGMLALRAFAVGHFAAKLAWSFLISLSNPSREKKKTGPGEAGRAAETTALNDRRQPA